MTWRAIGLWNILVITASGIIIALAFSLAWVDKNYGTDWAFAVLFSAIFIIVNAILVLFKLGGSGEDDLS